MSTTPEDLMRFLQETFGDEVITGEPVAAAQLDALEKELRVRLPADYRDFIAKYGWVQAGPFKEVLIFGIDPKGAAEDFPGDVRKARALWITAIESLADTFSESREALDPLIAAVPFLGALDFPHCACGVFDAKGSVRTGHPSPSLLSNGEPVLSASDGRDFDQFVRDAVEAG